MRSILFKKAAALVTVSVLLAGCGRQAERTPGGDARHPGEAPPPAGADGSRSAPPEDPLQRRAEALAREIYAALAKGDAGPLETRLDPGGTEVMVEENTSDQPYYALAERGSAFDWQPLLDWARARPAATIREVSSTVSPHDPRYILVSLRLDGGYFFLGLADGASVTKVFAQLAPAIWD